jgi:hypothetical protein
VAIAALTPPKVTQHTSPFVQFIALAHASTTPPGHLVSIAMHDGPAEALPSWTQHRWVAGSHAEVPQGIVSRSPASPGGPASTPLEEPLPLDDAPLLLLELPPPVEEPIPLLPTPPLEEDEPLPGSPPLEESAPLLLPLAPPLEELALLPLPVPPLDELAPLPLPPPLEVLAPPLLPLLPCPLELALPAGATPEELPDASGAAPLM